MSSIPNLDFVVKILNLFPGSEVVQGSNNPPQEVSGSSGSPLVSSIISRGKSFRDSRVSWMELYPRSLKLIRKNKHLDKCNPGKKGKISDFSASSRRRLRFTAGNAFPELISQFGMTYPKRPVTGLEIRRDRDVFLRRLREGYPGVGYLWVREFQNNSRPHCHLYLALSVETPGLRRFLAESWNEIVAPGDRSHFRVHSHPKNFIRWSMGSGSYLCKYLDKAHQKKIPPGFEDAGRFWGSSRGLVPSPTIVNPKALDQKYSYESVDEQTGEVEDLKGSAYILRSITKCEEKGLRKHRCKYSWAPRKGNGSYTIQSGGLNYRRLCSYLDQEANQRNIRKTKKKGGLP